MAGVVGDYVLCDCTLKDHDHFVTTRQPRRHRQLYLRRTGLIADHVGLTDLPKHNSDRNLRSHGQEMLRQTQSEMEEYDTEYYHSLMVLKS